ncbi:recombinase RecB [Longimycelium tulufanense]|uniref:Recombinase RecB n=1 Tax=Longimycelium tulufanense TaxID=907463 RepID=A0A8J3CEJ2_9PSEU|nr:recombinase family protein [Longimycelium tulufanense]GGM82840.1 recombinase RecB [Longimycelium tulufanense]
MARSRTAHRTKKPVTLDDFDTVRVGIYLRRSTDDEHQPYSIEAQDNRLEAYINSQPGWRLVARFPDDASGASTQRDGLQRALAAAQAGLFDVLLVYRVDRFSRNLRDMVTLLDDLDEAGVVFRSATEPFDTATPMGRMLVQMLGMFAQFERDTIIDRVIAGMERKAAKGKWKGGSRPFGYTVDKKTHVLVPQEHESVLVRLVFELYTRDRLGANSIAATLNERGFRTSTGKLWSRQTVLRILVNRIYLGELSFRDVTTENCHPALVDPNTFAETQRLMELRGDRQTNHAANGSDYIATGRLRCPRCGKAMIGTRATGRSKTYRYYTCWTNNRVGNHACDMPRLNADDLDQALIDAVADFYATQHALISDAVQAAQQHHHAQYDQQHAELDTVTAEITKVTAKINRYLDAFENGTLEPATVQERLAGLQATLKQLRSRHAELSHAVATPPTMPDPITLDDIATHARDILRTGSPNQRKAVIEVLVARVDITGPNSIVPVFRIPQPAPDTAAGTDQSVPATPVRTMSHLVGRVGLEPTT